jgi:2-hydroxychromene-2-carboxylate isomerase
MSIKTLQYWFSYGSTYTYLTVSRIEAVTQSRGVDIEWKPFNMKSITRELGMPRGPSETILQNSTTCGEMLKDGPKATD